MTGIIPTTPKPMSTSGKLNPGRVVTTLYHTNTGAARIRVTAGGRSRAVPYDYSSSDPFLSAMLEVLGRETRVNDSERNHGGNRIIFYVAL